MKNLLYTALFGLLLIGCNTNTETEDSLSNSTFGNTLLEDSIYHFFNLGELDTLEGFDEYFSDSNSIKYIENLHKLLGEQVYLMQEECNDTNSEFFNSVGDEELDSTIAFFKSLAIEDLKIEIHLYQKKEVLFKGCYEGTMNNSEISFREDSLFDIYWKGVFSSRLTEGSYTRIADTLVLKYDTKQPVSVGDSLLIKNDSIITLNMRIGGGRYLIFYKGDCRGLN